MGGEPGGLVGRTCFAPIPVELVIDEGLVIDTDAECDVSVAPNLDLCFIAAQRIVISGTVVARGSRPLVLWSATTIDVTSSGRIDVASHVTEPRPGAGANAVSCGDVDGVADTLAPNTGGGGCGGALGTDGGAGGRGGAGPTPASASVCDPAPVPLGGKFHGGCRGGNGGHGTNIGGASGGAVYLMAAQTITVGGRINASGAGGTAATTNDGNVLPGGGGGGSGGMIVFETPTLVTTGAVLLAVGGGGGSGSGLVTSSPLAGNPGGEASIEGPGPYFAPASTMTVATNIGAPNAIDGGLSGGDVVPGSTGGGGGGSGGHGYVLVFPPKRPAQSTYVAVPDFPIVPE